MMRQTPRTFVGAVVLTVDRPVCAHVRDAVRTGLGRLPGISSCDVDVATGAVVVTAVAPVDRADVVAVLEGLGCRVRA